LFGLRGEGLPEESIREDLQKAKSVNMSEAWGESGLFEPLSAPTYKHIGEGPTPPWRRKERPQKRKRRNYGDV